jgi:hypothetical protein
MPDMPVPRHYDERRTATLELEMDVVAPHPKTQTRGILHKESNEPKSNAFHKTTESRAPF